MPQSTLRDLGKLTRRHPRNGCAQVVIAVRAVAEHHGDVRDAVFGAGSGIASRRLLDAYALVVRAAKVAEPQGQGAWEFDTDDTVETVRVQAIVKGTVATAAGATSTTAPKVRWLVDDGDAVRLHIRNTDGDWACALVVLRPAWPLDDAVEVQGKLRGIWYDSGTSIVADSAPGVDGKTGGRHHCSPANIDDLAMGGTTYRHGLTSTTNSGNDPVPNSGADWTISWSATPGSNAATADQDTANDAIAQRLFQRKVPEFVG